MITISPFQSNLRRVNSVRSSNILFESLGVTADRLFISRVRLHGYNNRLCKGENRSSNVWRDAKVQFEMM